MRVGIPRALLYYHFYPMWRAFFEALDVECVVSPPTNKKILANGVQRVTGETCLPIKLYCGHVVELADDVDYVFAPLVRTLGSNEENCPRLLALPDLVCAVIPQALPVLAPEIDLEKGPRGFAAAVLGLGITFSRNPLRIKRAADCAVDVYRRYQSLLSEGATMPAAIALLEQNGRELPVRPESGEHGGGRNGFTIGVLGHAYNLYDTYVNHNLMRRLPSLGVNVLTADGVPAQAARQSTEQHLGDTYWTFEYELVGAGAYYLERCKVDGLIAIAAFACGPDAVMLDALRRLAQRYHVPLLGLITDEHTGEAGLVTRVEAFVDMLERKTAGRGVYMA